MNIPSTPPSETLNSKTILDNNHNNGQSVLPKVKGNVQPAPAQNAKLGATGAIPIEPAPAPDPKKKAMEEARKSMPYLFLPMCERCGRTERDGKTIVRDPHTDPQRMVCVDCYNEIYSNKEES